MFNMKQIHIGKRVLIVVLCLIGQVILVPLSADKQDSKDVPSGDAAKHNENQRNPGEEISTPAIKEAAQREASKEAAAQEAAIRDAAVKEAAQREAVKEAAAKEAAMRDAAAKEAAQNEAAAKEAAQREAAQREAAAKEAAAKEAAAQREAAAKESAAREAAAKEAAAKEAAVKEAAAKEVAAKEVAAKEAAAKEAAEREAAQRDAAAKEAAQREAAAKEAAAKEAAQREAAAKETAAKEVPAKEAAAREATQKEAAAKEVAQKEASAREAAAKEAAMRDAAAKEAAEREAAAKEAAEREAAAKEAAAREAAAKEAAAKEAAQREAAAREAAAKEADVREAAAKETAAKEAAAKEAAAKEAAAKEAAQREAAQREAAAKEAAQREAAAKEAAQREAAAKEAAAKEAAQREAAAREAAAKEAAERAAEERAAEEREAAEREAAEREAAEREVAAKEAAEREAAAKEAAERKAAKEAAAREAAAKEAAAREAAAKEAAEREAAEREAAEREAAAREAAAKEAAEREAAEREAAAKEAAEREAAAKEAAAKEAAEREAAEREAAAKEAAEREAAAKEAAAKEAAEREAAEKEAERQRDRIVQNIEAPLPARPNIIIFIADGVIIGDMGGKKVNSRTPNLNKIAENGVLLTNHIAGGLTDTSSRAALLTGRLPMRYGMSPDGQSDVISTLASKSGLPPSETTFAKRLQESGYTSALIGKWNLGMSCHTLEDLCHHPTKHGFDYFFGMPLLNHLTFHDDIPAEELIKRPLLIAAVALVVSLLLRRPLGTTAVFIMALSILGVLGWSWYCINNPHIWANALMRNKDLIEQPVNFERMSERMVKEGVRFMKKAKADDKPFLLVMSWMQSPPDPKYSKEYHDTMGKDMKVRSLDRGVGEVMRAARNLGLDSNMVFYFTTTGEEPKETGEMVSLPIVPGLLQWSGVIPAGHVIDEMTSHLDIMPTLVKAAGGDLPAVMYDGQSLMPSLKGRKDSPRELFHYCGSALHAISYSSENGRMYLGRLFPATWHGPPYHCGPPVASRSHPNKPDTMTIYDLSRRNTKGTPVPPSRPDHRGAMRTLNNLHGAHQMSLKPADDQYTWYNQIWHGYMQPSCALGESRCTDSDNALKDPEF